MIWLFRLCKQSQFCHFLCEEVRTYGIRAMSKLVLLLLMVEMLGGKKQHSSNPISNGGGDRGEGGGDNEVRAQMQIQVDIRTVH